MGHREGYWTIFQPALGAFDDFMNTTIVMRQCNGVTLYNANCLDILPKLVVDAVITDPPYGISWDGNAKRFTQNEQFAVEHRLLERMTA